MRVNFVINGEEITIPNVQFIEEYGTLFLRIKSEEDDLCNMYDLSQIERLNVTLDKHCKYHHDDCKHCCYDKEHINYCLRCKDGNKYIND